MNIAKAIYNTIATNLRKCFVKANIEFKNDFGRVTSTSGCEQKISTFGLINMDEFNQYNERMMTILKNLMQMKKVTTESVLRPIIATCQESLPSLIRVMKKHY